MLKTYLLSLFLNNTKVDDFSRKDRMTYNDFTKAVEQFNKDRQCENCMRFQDDELSTGQCDKKFDIKDTTMSCGQWIPNLKIYNKKDIHVSRIVYVFSSIFVYMGAILLTMMSIAGASVQFESFKFILYAMATLSVLRMLIFGKNYLK